MIINDINEFYNFILNTDFDIVVRGREVFRDGEKIMEYMAMAALNPEEFKIVEELENELNENMTTRKKFFTILPSGKRMSDIRRDAESLMFDPEEIYPTINNATKCGVFCNR